MFVQTNPLTIPSAAQKSGGGGNIPTGLLSELLQSKLLPDWYTLLASNLVFFSAAAAANPTAFTGGAAGTPLAAIYNPVGSNKILVPLAVSIGIRTTGTVAGSVDFNLYGGPSAANTGVQTNPTNALSLQTTGSLAKGYINTVLTGSAAINPIMPLLSVGTVTVTPGLNIFTGLIPLFGMGVCVEGNLIALGASATLTGAAVDATVIWAELPK